MWFIDIVMDIEWYNARSGSLGPPQARAKRRAIGSDVGIELLIYGDRKSFRHLRVLVEHDDHEIVQAVQNTNIESWISMYEVASVMGPGAYSKPATIPGTDSFVVLSNLGDEHAPTLSVDVSKITRPSIDYRAAALLTSSWDETYLSEVWFAARFLNPSVPLELRWLNAYRLLEWHFTRGRSSLSHRKDWRDVLSARETELRTFLSKKQTLHGLIEQVRASCAHAIVATGSTPGRDLGLALETFPIMEKMALAVLLKATGGKVGIEKDQHVIGPVQVRSGSTK